MIRKGMWVVDGEGRLGIAARVDPVPGRTELHYVKDDGTTAEVVVVPTADLRQAKAAEIPAARVSHLTAEQLAACGYGE